MLGDTNFAVGYCDFYGYLVDCTSKPRPTGISRYFHLHRGSVVSVMDKRVKVPSFVRHKTRSSATSTTLPTQEALPIDIYIKPKKKATLSDQPAILIQDVAEIVAATDIAKKIRKMKLVDIGHDAEQKKNYLVSVTDIIKTIKKTYPDYTVNNVGEMDTLVQYAVKKSHDRPWLKWLRIAFVVAVLFVGSSTAIMSFHTDGQMPKIFENYYRMFYGETKSNPLIVNIPYSIGVAVGIIVFYNHFMGKKITDDPTPIEVEMELYENDVTDTVVEVLSQRKKAKEDGVKSGTD